MLMHKQVIRSQTTSSEFGDLTTTRLLFFFTLTLSWPRRGAYARQALSGLNVA
jgi:hypothetical protein